MKTTIRLFCIVLAFLSVTVSPQARAVCQEGCLTNDNTVLGDNALLNNNGIENTAVGSNALNTNTSGNYNTAIGFFALFNNTTGQNNTATGYGALISNATGFNNTGTGTGALFLNTIGHDNTASGLSTLAANTTGSANTATGAGALYNNVTGGFNTAIGVGTLSDNTDGNHNTAIGYNALLSNSTGTYNIAVGVEAGRNLTTGSNNIDIANRGVAGEANTIRIGTREKHTNTFIAGITGVTIAGGVGVIIDSKGHLGTVVSSARFKEAIKPMDKASEAILALKPVTFRYKKEIDPDRTPEFGLVAEDVEKVNPDLVARDAGGKVYTVRYDAVNAMLLNEFLKEHSKVEKLEATVAQQRKDFEAAVTELKVQIQKVSAHLELSKPATQTVLNNH